MHWIHDQIAVSGLYDLHLAEPIDAVLNVCETRPYDPPEDVAYLHRGFPDVQPFPLEIVWECVQWLDRHLKSGRRALVHCSEGNSRSVTVAIAYLLFKGYPLDEVERNILKRKPFTQIAGKPTAEKQYFQEVFLGRWQRFISALPASR